MDKTKIQQLMEKWSPVLDHASVSPIKELQKRQDTAVLLENTAQAGAWAVRVRTIL